MRFHTKPQGIQNHYLTGSLKQMDLLKPVMDLNVSHYFIMVGLIKFVIGINNLQVKKSGITDSIHHNFGKLRIDSFDSLPIEKPLSFHNVIMLIKW